MLPLRTVIALCGCAYLLGVMTSTPAQDADQKQKKDDPWTWELRIYTTADGKLDDLNKRFRDHTVKLFEKHGMRNVAYWTITNDNKHEDKNNTLVYLLAHKSREAAAESWKNFMADPDWQAAWKASKKDGPVVTGVKSYYLKRTDYSPEPFRAVRPRRQRNRRADAKDDK